MDTETGDFCITGCGGSAEDQKFDALVGTIEEFMMTYDLEATKKRVLPPFNDSLSDHEKHKIYRAFVERVEKDLERRVMQSGLGFSSIEEVAQMLEARHDEIDDDVADFVNEGCFEYSTFLVWWKGS